VNDGGWYQEDEDRWEEAVDVLVGEIEKGDAFRRADDGAALIKFVANISLRKSRPTVGGISIGIRDGI